MVSLLVRLWVEICPNTTRHEKVRGQPPCEAVSWNGFWEVAVSCVKLSASLWGCELKYSCIYISGDSLYVSLLVRLWVEISLSLIVFLWPLSASLWGCELKYKWACAKILSFSSASLWGCELKCSMPPLKWEAQVVSLLVRLWVEIHLHQLRITP